MERRMSVNELAAYLGLSRATVWLRCKRHNIIPTPDPDNLRVHLYVCDSDKLAVQRHRRIRLTVLCYAYNICYLA